MRKNLRRRSKVTRLQQLNIRIHFKKNLALLVGLMAGSIALAEVDLTTAPDLMEAPELAQSSEIPADIDTPTLDEEDQHIDEGRSPDAIPALSSKKE